MEQKIANDRFLALSRICLNNWHYKPKGPCPLMMKLIFTGHSGSGKSGYRRHADCALCQQLDGRGFFNKAAADDLDRSLIEYLRV